MVGQWGKEDDEKVVIRCYNDRRDRIQMECVEKSCEIGNDQTFLFTDTLGDPICRIRNTPLCTMLVADVGTKLVGSIQGSVKPVKFHDKSVNVGYVLGLRVVPPYRRCGIGSILVRKLEEWFVSHNVDYAYMATQKDNEASLGLFVGTLGYTIFRNPAILVNPVNPGRRLKLPSDIGIRKLKVEEAASWYRTHVAPTTDFFPDDIDKILGNKLSMGTWVGYYNNNDKINSWAIVSVWNSSKVFKLRIGKAPLSYVLLTKVCNLLGRFLLFLGLTALPDLFTPFGFYFLYGVHAEGPLRGKLVRALCDHVNNMAASDDGGACKVLVVEVDGENNGDDGSMSRFVPHWKMLSCDDDTWCIKPLKCEEKMTDLGEFNDMFWKSKSATLFVDPRDV
ncbi:Acyl-CoA N-acyltransferases (NAT) superfamily protein [Raphanus sativus]|uniref:Probable N-acetyltransferase HLS1 n=1 Tax=Raphanus sativus TaxID=3726 RepID=A0A6J0NDN3_RAPSA|nr:probable N-acetyltransferase HLS1 [Raphanus sativus]KAJ4903247.1 Acyl-CoA N-acyltransferases (NAT) superfamily protein [Raphanus sativus]